MEQQEIIMAIGAAIGALFSAMQVVSKWREEQRQENKIARKLGQAEKRVTFLDTWRKSQASISPPERQSHIDQYVARELDILMVETLYTTDHRTSILQSSRRWLLLFMPRSFFGWMARFGFFCTFPMFVLGIPICISEIRQDMNEAEATPPVAAVASEDVPADSTNQSEPDFMKMTVQERGAWMAENRPEAFESGVLLMDSMSVQKNLSDADHLSGGLYAEDSTSDTENLIIGFSFFGMIALGCYLVSVFDGRERKKSKSPERDPLPKFLRYLEQEIEIIDEAEARHRAA